MKTFSGAHMRVRPPALSRSTISSSTLGAGSVAPVRQSTVASGTGRPSLSQSGIDAAAEPMPFQVVAVTAAGGVQAASAGRGSTAPVATSIVRGPCQQSHST